MVGENIRRIRSARNMQQLTLAEKAGVTPQQINMIEMGRRGLSITTLINIVLALDCSADDILFGGGRNNGNRTTSSHNPAQHCD